MSIVRSKGPDIVIRHAGRRLRIGKDWCEVSDDAIEKVRSEGGENLEEQDPGSPAPAGETSHESDGPDKTEGVSADTPAPTEKGKKKGSK